jgi:transcriptional regulator with XRE-family HTH domain
MTPQEFRAARKSLGLSVNQMAALLEVRPVHVRKMELAEDLPSHRRIMPATGKLVEAFLAGYRCRDWPATKTRQRSS